MQAGGVNQGAHVIRIEFERSLRPFHGARFLTIGEERARAQRERSSVTRIQNQGVFSAMNALSQGFARFFRSSEHAQRLRKEQRTLKVFVANFGCHGEELRGSFNVAVRKGGTREIVVGVE